MRRAAGMASVAMACGLALGGCSGSDTGPDPLHSISGTVGGATAAGVTVSLAWAGTASTVTDGAGRFAFAGLADGTYMVTPGRAGYSFVPARAMVTVDGADVTGQDFTATAVASTHAISGTVGGATAADVTVSLTGAETAFTVTDGEGQYDFGGLADGDYAVTPFKGGCAFAPARAAVRVEGADVPGQDFTATCTPSSAAGGGAAGSPPPR